MERILCEDASFDNAISHYPIVHSGGMEPRDLLKALMARDEVNSNSLALKLKGKPSQPQIYKYLTGVSREPRRSTLQPLADYFGVELDAFYDAQKAEQAMRDLGLTVPHAGEPAAAYAPAAAPAPDIELTPEIRQLLQDLEDLHPARVSKFLDMVHQAAEEAREAAKHLASKAGKVAAARRTVVKAAHAIVSWGDGNERQTSLPLATVKDPFTAAPGQREAALYGKIEKAPKK